MAALRYTVDFKLSLPLISNLAFKPNDGQFEFYTADSAAQAMKQLCIEEQCRRSVEAIQDSVYTLRISDLLFFGFFFFWQKKNDFSRVFWSWVHEFEGTRIDIITLSIIAAMIIPIDFADLL